MTWIKLSDAVWTHPKILAIDPTDRWLWVASIAYANVHLTDGRIPKAAMLVLGIGFKNPAASAGRLVAAGLWETDDSDGWRIHDYAQHQRSSEEIKNGQPRAGARTRVPAPAPPRAGARTSAQEEKRIEENPPVVPPRGGRQRDRARWEKDVEAFAEEHFPQLERSVRVRAVRQAFRYGHAQTPQEVTAFILQHFPELQEQLES